MDDAQVDPVAFRLLMDRYEITEVMRRYARACDRQDPEALASCYHAGASEDHGVYRGSATAFVEWVTELWRSGSLAGSNHVLTNELVEVAADGRSAIAESYFLVHMARSAPAGALDELLAGRYLDRFERRDGRWAITARSCVYDWARTDPVPPETWLTRVPGNHTLGTTDRTDASYALGLR